MPRIQYKIVGECSADEEDIIEEAVESARELLEELIAFCTTTGLYHNGGHSDVEKSVFKKWFGSYKKGREAAWEVYNKIYEYSGTVTIKPHFDMQNSLHPRYQNVDMNVVHAFTSEDNGDRFINLCYKFYARPENRESRARTLIHELTHYCSETEDYNLNASTAEREAEVLALNNSNEAMKCAYNFEFFAKHIPEKELFPSILQDGFKKKLIDFQKERERNEAYAEREAKQTGDKNKSYEYKRMTRYQLKMQTNKRQKKEESNEATQVQNTLR